MRQKCLNYCLFFVCKFSPYFLEMGFLFFFKNKTNNLRSKLRMFKRTHAHVIIIESVDSAIIFLPENSL